MLHAQVFRLSDYMQPIVYIHFATLTKSVVNEVVMPAVNELNIFNRS